MDQIRISFRSRIVTNSHAFARHSDAVDLNQVMVLFQKSHSTK
jgi:hypothetical protein